MNRKIGLAVITFNRLDYLKQCIESLQKNNWGGAEVRVVVDDGSDYEGYPEYLDFIGVEYGIEVLQLDVNSGVATAKNVGLQFLMDKQCTDLFLMEDDILMKNPTTCIKYITYGMIHKLQHINFALHGQLNKGRGRIVDGVACYPNIVGAFSYYTREVIEIVGYMDTNFVNAWEHVEHTYRVASMGYTTPFWFFADHIDSKDLLVEIEGSIDNSSIRPRNDWKDNIEKGKVYWIKKHGSFLPPSPY